MRWWMIVLIVLLVLFLLAQLRLGGRVRYGEDGLWVTVIAGPARIQMLPQTEKARKKKEKKAEKAKKAKPKKEKPKKEKPKKEKPEGAPGTVERVMKLLPVVGEAAGALHRKIRIDELSLGVIWGGSDPAAVALGYGRSYMLLGMIWPIFEHNFKVKKHDFQVDLDYERTSPAVSVSAALTMTIGQLLGFGFHYGLKALITWIRSGKSSKKQQEG